MTDSAREIARGLVRAGRLAEAEGPWRGILAGDPGDAEALHMVGFILASTGRRAEGLALMDRSLDRDPDHPGFLDNRAQVLAIENRLPEALRDLARAVRLAPRFLEGWVHLAQVSLRLGRPAEALKAAQAAFELAPANAAAVNTLGVSLRENGRVAEALDCFERAARAGDGTADAWNNYGLALQHAGRFDEARAAYARALQMRPRFTAALANLAVCLRDAGDLEGAAARFDEALSWEPESPEILGNAAGVALERQLLGAARDLYERASRARAGYADAGYGLGQVALRERRYADGWRGFERRFDTRPPLAARPQPPPPELDEAGLDGVRRLGVRAEQGIGDQVLFSTLLPELERRGIAAVVEVDPRLLAMYRRSLPSMEFVPRGAPESCYAQCDRQAAIGSLGRWLRPDAASFARQPRGLLEADADRVAQMRAALGHAPATAIAWRSPQGGRRRGIGERKSIPLDCFAGLAVPGGPSLVDLQYGDVARERETFERAHPGVLRRIDGLDVFEDLEGLAAALVACGRLVTSSNVTAHLAGALGVPTKLAYLGDWPPFFYWVPGPDGRSAWYPSVEIVTGPDWDAVFAELAGGE
jgi:tetratricopeptide (TPR) repeat protein